MDSIFISPHILSYDFYTATYALIHNPYYIPDYPTVEPEQQQQQQLREFVDQATQTCNIDQQNPEVIDVDNLEQIIDTQTNAAQQKGKEREHIPVQQHSYSFISNGLTVNPVIVPSPNVTVYANSIHQSTEHLPIGISYAYTPLNAMELAVLLDQYWAAEGEHDFKEEETGEYVTVANGHTWMPLIGKLEKAENADRTLYKCPVGCKVMGKNREIRTYHGILANLDIHLRSNECPYPYKFSLPTDPYFYAKSRYFRCRKTHMCYNTAFVQRSERDRHERNVHAPHVVLAPVLRDTRNAHSIFGYGFQITQQWMEIMRQSDPQMVVEAENASEAAQLLSRFR